MPPPHEKKLCHLAAKASACEDLVEYFKQLEEESTAFRYAASQATKRSRPLGHIENTEHVTRVMRQCPVWDSYCYGGQFMWDGDHTVRLQFHTSQFTARWFLGFFTTDSLLELINTESERFDDPTSPFGSCWERKGDLYAQKRRPILCFPTKIRFNHKHLGVWAEEWGDATCREDVDREAFMDLSDLRDKLSEGKSFFLGTDTVSLVTCKERFDGDDGPNLRMNKKPDPPLLAPFEVRMAQHFSEFFGVDVKLRFRGLAICREGSTLEIPTAPSDAVGTVMVVLRENHSGIQMKVGHENNTTRFDWGRCWTRGLDFFGPFAFVAYHRDAIPEILPLRSGNRATLVYGIVIAGPTPYDWSALTPFGPNCGDWVMRHHRRVVKEEGEKGILNKKLEPLCPTKTKYANTSGEIRDWDVIEKWIDDLIGVFEEPAGLGLGFQGSPRVFQEEEEVVVVVVENSESSVYSDESGGSDPENWTENQENDRNLSDDAEIGPEYDPDSPDDSSMDEHGEESGTFEIPDRRCFDHPVGIVLRWGAGGGVDVGGLVGQDRVLYEALTRRGIRCQLVPIVVRHDKYGSRVGAFTKEDITHIAANCSKKTKPPQICVRRFPLFKTYDAKSYVWVCGRHDSSGGEQGDDGDDYNGEDGLNDLSTEDRGNRTIGMGTALIAEIGEGANSIEVDVMRKRWRVEKAEEGLMALCRYDQDYIEFPRVVTTRDQFLAVVLWGDSTCIARVAAAVAAISDVAPIRDVIDGLGHMATIFQLNPLVGDQQLGFKCDLTRAARQSAASILCHRSNEIANQPLLPTRRKHGYSSVFDPDPEYDSIKSKFCILPLIELAAHPRVDLMSCWVDFIASCCEGNNINLEGVIFNLILPFTETYFNRYLPLLHATRRHLSRSVLRFLDVKAAPLVMETIVDMQTLPDPANPAACMQWKTRIGNLFDVAMILAHKTAWRAVILRLLDLVVGAGEIVVNLDMFPKSQARKICNEDGAPWEAQQWMFVPDDTKEILLDMLKRADDIPVPSRFAGCSY